MDHKYSVEQYMVKEQSWPMTTMQSNLSFGIKIYLFLDFYR